MFYNIFEKSKLFSAMKNLFFNILTIISILGLVTRTLSVTFNFNVSSKTNQFVKLM